MERLVNFEIDEIKKIDFDDYSDEEFAIARMGFLSTKPNSHKLKISEKVLTECAKSVLDKWVVADMQFGEPTTHTKNEHIVGKIPKDQSIEFIYDEDGYLRAYVDTVISKIYAKDFCEAFALDANRAVSVEMKVTVSEDDENEVIGFVIIGVTVLGKTVKPSCPDSDITFVRFSDEKANRFFEEQRDTSTALQKFVNERKQSMADKSYKIDKSKEAMSGKAWGDVDKTDLRNRIMEASNKAKLVKDVYMLVEDGWEDAPSEHLKYPVMCFEGDTLVYNRYALAAGLSYAKQEDETEVINKIERIYKKLDIDDSEGKEEDVKMNEIEFDKVETEEPADENQNLAESEEVVNQPVTEDGKADKDESKAETDDEDEQEEDMAEKLAKLEQDIEERDNIIMEKDKELEELRQFKADVEEKEKAKSVEGIMAEVKEFLDDEAFKAYREEGMLCKMSEIDGWANKVKAASFEASKNKKSKKENTSIWGFAAPISNNSKKSDSVWDRI